MLMELMPDFVRLLSIGLLLLVPLFLIYKKAGFSPFWAFLVFIPLGLLFICVHLAYRPWPNSKNGKESV